MSSARDRYAAACATGNAADIDAALADLMAEQRRTNVAAIERGAIENPTRLPPIRAYSDETRSGPVAHNRQPATTPPLRLLSLDEFVVRPAISWHVRDLMPSESIVVVFGPPKCGKTYWLADLMMHGAHGMHWHGHTIGRPMRVAYLAGEGQLRLRVRLHAWRMHHEAEMRGAMAILPESLALADRVSDIVTLLRDYRPDVVVCDTVNAYFGGGDENSTKDMTTFVAAVRAIRDSLHSSVVVIHHTGLTAQDRERGSNALRGAADVIVQVARDESGSGSIGVQVIAARDMEPWGEPLALRLEQVATDWLDDDGHPITACVVLSSDTPVSLPGRRERALSDAQSTVLAAAREIAATRRNGSPDVLLAREDVSALARERGIDRRRVSECWDSLARRKLIRLVEPGSVIVRLSP